MMSISPHMGQGLVFQSLPTGIIQKAGQVPLPLGNLMLASK